MRRIQTNEKMQAPIKATPTIQYVAFRSLKIVAKEILPVLVLCSSIAHLKTLSPNCLTARKVPNLWRPLSRFS